MAHHHSFNKIRNKLIEEAKAGRTINYSYFILGGYGVARGAGKPWKIGEVLGDICLFEKEHKRPLLGAICVTKAKGIPSDTGFWGFLGLDGPDRNAWEKERNRVWKYWQTHDC